MDTKRRIARVVAVLAVALGAGHLVQTMAAGKDPAPRPSAALREQPKDVQTVAAGPEAVKSAAPVVADVAMPKLPLVILAPPVLPQPAPAALAPEAEPQPMEPAALADACPVTLDVLAVPGAIIGLTLTAPCQPNSRVVLQHAGLAVTGMTSATGSLFTDLPALEADATVTAILADGTRAEAQLTVPDLAGLRRFGVQWQGDDAFQLHAFETGPYYGQPGDVSAANPRAASAALPAAQGYLMQLGDPAAPAPLLAEVYTYPADPAAKPEIVVEAGVTDKTCGREILGETLASAAGRAEVQYLTVAMPECDSAGGYLVLKNLAPDMNIASVN